MGGRSGARLRSPVRQDGTRGSGRFVVITGLSGSGKSQAIRALEDLGYFCVDNLPTMLIPTLAQLSLQQGTELQKVAIVVDVREGTFLSQFPTVWRRLKKMPRLEPSLIFLEATHAALVRRFSETRRPHPLAANRSVERGHPRRARTARRDPVDGRRDRGHVGPDRARAAQPVHDLRARPGAPLAARREPRQLRVQARRAARRRPGVRRAVPAEPALRAAPASRSPAAIGRSCASSNATPSRRSSCRSCRTCCGSWCRST